MFLQSITDIQEQHAGFGTWIDNLYTYKYNTNMNYLWVGGSVPNLVHVPSNPIISYLTTLPLANLTDKINIIMAKSVLSGERISSFEIVQGPSGTAKVFSFRN